MAGLLALLLGACAGVSDSRPSVVRDSERYLERGVAAFQDDDYVSAAQLFGKALRRYQSIDNPQGVLLSHINLAETALALGNPRAVAAQLDAAQGVLDREPGLAEHAPRVTLLRASNALDQGDAETAMLLLPPLLPALDSAAVLSPTARAALVLRTRAAFLTGEDPTDWILRLHRDLEAGGAIPPADLARLKRFQARLAAGQGRGEEAAARYREALEIYRSLAARRAIAMTLEEWAGLSIAEADWPGAKNRLERALLVRSWLQDRSGVARILETQQIVHAALGDTRRTIC